MARGIERALEKDPDRRWQSAAELMPAIESGRATGWRAQSRRRGRRPWIAAVIVAAALATAAALLCGTTP